ncbi:hypothetical protein A3C26_02650 [Candidatus Daviesbacteria bacterium RIFCSPHIGHO2_02_FULL_39_12]|uniref:Uncharacterized protein n=2 Tax=Candidatus Daviesiibacteriota TaxID=1752718 RepID=A0A1F5JDM7_9BACT|nr:MAG: hypothetical protein A3C26_02650 [Candidatus Daviesbacteria bacterium RIFCSPHIGHO2_02_FULL_39_12]OGE71544.1 MAG: hypothetical protein A3H40_00785 [Candidatus Daviesbacteria bacterium RIFCSPLOWO2_02_FULL_38_15]
MRLHFYPACQILSCKLIDEWYILVVPNSPNNTITFEASEAVKTKFWRNHKVRAVSGWVVPTGEKGEAARIDIHPLFTYKQAA